MMHVCMMCAQKEYHGQNNAIGCIGKRVRGAETVDSSRMRVVSCRVYHKECVNTCGKKRARMVICPQEYG